MNKLIENKLIRNKLIRNKKKRGFTIVELLAVLIILAVVALIGSAVVKKTIEKSRIKAVERGAELYINTVETAVAAARLKGNIIEGEFVINEKGDLCPEEAGVKCSEDKQILIEMIGNKPSQGTLWIYDGHVLPHFLIAIKESKNLYSVKRDGDDSEYITYKGYDLSNVPSWFGVHSWDTIAKNVKAGNLSKYKVGDTKEVTLDGFGSLTVRIANTSTPSECSASGFSQTACGFVLEFEDIITKHVMNSTDTNVGGWRDSAMRTYINDTILKSLPTDLQKVIIDTKAISGHGYRGSSNFATTDKLYLFSTKEIWGKEGASNAISEDTAEAKTRQLDYYKNKGVTTSNYSGAIKQYNGSNSLWWLRSASSSSIAAFYSVDINGGWDYCNAAYGTYGVAPAFRIG